MITAITPRATEKSTCAVVTKRRLVGVLVHSVAPDAWVVR
jgi:hypothetical protein